MITEPGAAPSPVVLAGASYALGERQVSYAAAPDRARRIAQFQLTDNPQLWGWGSYWRAESGLAELAVRTGAATLDAAAVRPGDVDALFVCTTEAPDRSEAHGEFFGEIIGGLGLGEVACYGQTLSRCVNLLAAIDLANAMVRAGRYASILVITTDRLREETERLGSYALFSDGAASCLIRADPCADSYRLLCCACAQDNATLGRDQQISADLAREVNRRLLTPAGMKIGDLDGLLHTNIFTPLVVMKELQAGFGAAQLYTANIARVGHCYAADPLINLVDRAASAEIRPGGYYELASSVPGTRFGVLLQRIPDQLEAAAGAAGPPRQ